MLSRREALAALLSAAALPLMTGCNNQTAAPPPRSADADALKLLDSIAENLLRLQPETATSLGIDTGERAALRSQLADRSQAGTRRLAQQVKTDLDLVNAFKVDGLSHGTRTSLNVVRSAYATALEGFGLPYGDITVGGWRNTPYVVIQNVGAYLDTPRFLDSDHRVDNSADAEAYLARLQAYAHQLDGERERMQAARAVGLVPPAFLIDKAIAQMTLSAKAAHEGGGLVESIDRRSKTIQGNWADRARAITTKDVAPALDRQLDELRADRRVATDEAGIWARPHGDEFYRWALKASTTTTMTPDQVHEMGKSELQRLHAQMDGILKEIGYAQGSVGERMKALAQDPRYKFSEGDAGRAEIMAFIQDRLKWIRAQMPRAFNTVVNPNMEVKRLRKKSRARRPRTGGPDRSTARFPAGSGSI